MSGTKTRVSTPAAPSANGAGRGAKNGRAAGGAVRLEPRARRIADAIEELAGLSEGGPGVTRLAYTELERSAHELFTTWMRAAGCEVRTDPAGNTIATRPGRRTDAPGIGTGSHLDSVYTGGRFDGIAGVVSAVEVARLLAAEKVETVHPLRFVVFAGEEGARFGQACLGSKLAAGLSSVEELRERRDRDGISVAEAMQALGFDPAAAVARPWDPADWAAFLELHVEQGSVLERQQISVGAVDLISGSTRLELTLHGRASHTGGTPMRGRSDALAAAAEAILIAEEVALDTRHRGTRATVGRLDIAPGSITTIPGEARMSVDVRDVDADRQRGTAAEIVRRVQAVCDRRRVHLDVRLLADTSPVVLPVWVRQALTASASELGVSYRVMTSGASHDAQMINRVTPAGMVFVPSRDGLSHVPEEWTAPAEIATGVKVLASGLLRLDRDLAELAGYPERTAR
ncbi:MAG TPA: Zn-dependent hydrolase [Streptosporangiaceae bacterium]